MPEGLTRPLSLAVAVVAILSGAPREGIAAEDAAFPNTVVLGKAAVRYAGEGLVVAAAYYYSQRHHDSPWLLIQAGLASNAYRVFEREAFAMLTPDGRAVPLASQARFAADVKATRVVVQNATTVRHPMLQYLPGRSSTSSIRFFALPPLGTVRGDFHVDRDTAAAGDLFFESAAGAWPAGTYTLVITHGGGRAALPIELK